MPKKPPPKPRDDPRRKRPAPPGAGNDATPPDEGDGKNPPTPGGAPTRGGQPRPNPAPPRPGRDGEPSDGATPQLRDAMDARRDGTTDGAGRPIPGEVALADVRRHMALGFNIIPYNPDELVRKKGLRVYDMMRRHRQVKASLNLKKLAIIGPGWALEPSEEDDERAIQVADELTDDLLGMKGTFEDVLFDMLTALDYGFSLSEKVWNLDGGEPRIKAIKVRAPHQIDFEQDPFGNVTKIFQQQSAKLAELPPEKFVHLVYRGEFDNPYGNSDLREAYDPWWFSVNWAQWWATFGQKAADPPVIGHHPPGISGNQITKFHGILERLQAMSALTMPEGWLVELMETRGNQHAVFELALNHWSREMSLGLLVPEKMGFTGGGSTGTGAGGSYALSQTHMDAFFLVLQQLVRWLTAAIQEQLVDQMTLFRYGPDVEPPRFKLLELSAENKTGVVQLWTQLTTAGVVVSDFEDENHVRRLLGFQEKDEDARREIEESVKGEGQPQGPGADPFMGDGVGAPPFGKPEGKVLPFQRKGDQAPEPGEKAEADGRNEAPGAKRRLPFAEPPPDEGDAPPDEGTFAKGDRVTIVDDGEPPPDDEGRGKDAVPAA